jgi:hypothetical protein
MYRVLQMAGVTTYRAASCHQDPISYICRELATHYIDNRDHMAQWSLRALRDAKPDDKPPSSIPHLRESKSPFGIS